MTLTVRTELAHAALDVLVIAADVCHPPTWGWAARSFNVLQSLAERHRVSLLALAGADQAGSVEALRGGFEEVRTVPKGVARSGLGRRARQALSLLSRRSFQRNSVCTPQLQAALDSWTTERRFDVILIEGCHLAGLRLPAGPRLVVDEHNIEYELLGRHSDRERSPLRRVFNGIEFVKCRSEERGTWRRFDACLCTSAREAGVIRSGAPQTPVLVVPNGVDVGYFQPASGTGVRTDGHETLVFSGRMDYRPNVDAVVFFARDVLPLIRSRCAGTRLQIVGMNPAPEVLALAGEAVEVTGAVDDVRPYLAGAALAVAPLRIGGGTRLKILEAMAMGKAVVSTSIGCDGLGLKPGLELVVADEPSSLAEAICGLLASPQERRRLGTAARRRVLADYSWETVTARLPGFLTEVAQRRETAISAPG